MLYNQKGFGLIQALVAVAVGLIGFTALMTLQTNSLKAHKTVTTSSDFELLAANIEMGIANKSRCDNFFQTTNASGAIEAPVLDEGVPAQIKSLNLMGDQIARVGDRIGSGIKLESLTLEVLPQGSRPVVIENYGTPAVPHKKLLSKLKIVGKRDGNSYGGEELSKTIYIDVLVKQSNNLVSSCTRSGSGSTGNSSSNPILEATGKVNWNKATQVRGDKKGKTSWNCESADGTGVCTNGIVSCSDGKPGLVISRGATSGWNFVESFTTYCMPWEITVAAPSPAPVTGANEQDPISAALANYCTHVDPASPICLSLNATAECLARDPTDPSCATARVPAANPTSPQQPPVNPTPPVVGVNPPQACVPETPDSCECLSGYARFRCEDRLGRVGEDINDLR